MGKARSKKKATPHLREWVVLPRDVADSVIAVHTEIYVPVDVHFECVMEHGKPVFKRLVIKERPGGKDQQTRG